MTDGRVTTFGRLPIRHQMRQMTGSGGLNVFGRAGMGDGDTGEGLSVTIFLVTALGNMSLFW